MADPFSTYRCLTPESRALWERARRRVPAGVSSNVKFFPPYPIFMTHAAGSKIFDADGREYIDFCLSFGPVVAGHGHPRVMAAIREELDRSGTVIFGAPTLPEIVLAERLSSMIPSAEMVRFTNSGTEATLHALRIARGATGATRIVKFEGHYHGAHDAVLMNVDRPLPRSSASAGIPKATSDATIVLPFNDVTALRGCLEGERDIAAVIVEPIARGVIRAEPDFLATLRELTSRLGIVLIFDEVVSWPRVARGGAQELFGVTPDLTALGKAIGGGLPMAAVVGREDLMSLVVPLAGRDAEDTTPYVFHGGTYNGTPVAAAAGLAVLDLLDHGDTFANWMRAGDRARAALSEVFARRGIQAQVLGTGSMFDFYLTPSAIRSSREVWASDLEQRRAVDYRLLERGIYNSPLHRFHLSLAHSDDDVDRAIAGIEAALDRTGPHGAAL